MDQIMIEAGTPGARAVAKRGESTLLAALVSATVVYQLCVTMPVPATSNMIEGLHTTGALVGLAQGSFFLVSGLVAIIVAAYADHSERRRLLLVSLSVMCVGLLLAVVAPNVYVLMLARVLQAASGATFPLALRTLRETLSPQRFGQAMGIITATYGGVAGVDSILGGWLTDVYGFRSVFAVIAVFGIVVTVIVARTIPPFRGTATGRMDWWGAAILCLALTVVQAGIGSAANAPIAVTTAMVAVGLLLLVAFWLVERRRSHPLVPARYVGSRQVWPMLITSVFTLAAFLSVVNYTIPVLTQDDHVGFAQSATMSALLFILPVCTVNLVVAPLAGRFAPCLGWRRLMRLGLAGMVPVLVIMALGAQSRWLVFAAVPLLGMFACGAGLTAINGLSVILSPKESPGVLPGVNSTCFGIGSSLGITLAGLLSTQHGGAMSSFRNALWMSAVAAALAFLASLAVGGAAADSTERV